MQAAWKAPLQALARSSELAEQEQLCQVILAHCGSPLSQPLLDRALSELENWDRGLLWAGVAAQALRRGDFQTALSAEQAAQKSKYPQAVQAWLNLARWQSSRQNHPPAWLNTQAAHHMPSHWLQIWVQALLQAGHLSAAQTLLEKATDSSLRKQQLLGGLYEKQGAYHQALSHYQPHLQHPEIALRQAEVYKNLGKTTEAASLLRECLQTAPPVAASESQALLWARLHSQYLLCLTATRPEQVPAEQARWAQRHRPAEAADAPLHRQAPSPQAGVQRRLRLGYLAPDFGSHSIFHVIHPLFSGHNRSEFELYAYAGQTRQDPATAQLQACDVHWRNLEGLSVSQMAATIAQDHLDLLIDASGHTSQHLLPVLAYRPAPIQISGLCFNGGTGLPEVNYQLTDPICTPRKSPAAYESPLWLSSWLFWFPPVQPVPLCAPSGPPLLGCAHHPGRLSPEICQIWAQLLQAVPESRLLLKHRCFASPDTQAVFVERFAQAGIASERLRFEGASSYLDYLAFYNRLQLVLDPFPYHGGLTSAEALWMGVPLLNLQGPLQGGLSLLRQVHHPEWSAPSASALLEQAQALLSAPWDLAMRQALRAACEAAPFTQKALLLSELEGHLKTLAQAHGLCT